MNFAALFRVLLPETALELTALIVLFADLAFLRKAALKARVAVAAVLGSLGSLAALAVLPCAGSGGYRFGEELLLASGGLAAVAQVGILILTILTLLLFVGSSFTRHAAEYVALILMAAAGGLVVAAAQDLLVIFVGLELLSLSLYVLTAFNKHSERSSEAALKYYLFGGMSAAFLLFGFSYLYGLTGSTSLSALGRGIANMAGGTTPLFYVAWVLVLVGLGFKVAAVPFHLWAPDAYEGAPAPAAAFIASVSKIASFTLLMNICSCMLNATGRFVGQADEILRWLQAYATTAERLSGILALLAIASMIVGNLAALVQTSVRRLLAYSAIAHAGYILLGVCSFHRTIPTAAELHPIGMEAVARIFVHAFDRQDAVLYYVITYGLTVIGAFGVVDLVERATGSDQLDAFLGLHKRNPVLAATLLVFFLSLAGIPPLVGFWAKFNLFAAVLAVGAGPVPFALVALAVGLSAVSLYYYLQVLKRAYVTPAVDESPIRTHPVPLAVLVALAAAVLVAGCFPGILQSWIANAHF